jgi:hypothetical protein
MHEKIARWKLVTETLKVWQVSNIVWKKTLINQNYIHEGLKIKVSLGNACYFSVQNFSSLNCYPKI